MRYLLLVLVLVFCAPVWGQNTLRYTADDRAFRDGVELLEKEKYAAASRSFEKYLNQTSDQLLAVEASYYIAYCSMVLENQQADKQLSKFVEANPNHPKSQVAYFEAGMYYFKKGDYPTAVSNLEQVDLSHLSSEEKADALFSLGYAYLLDKKYEESKAKFEKVEYLGSKYKYAASYYLGYIYFKLK
ncbi:tetratricopeptide repeat protein, partial [Cyclobacteriaceae bacterium]|nr:tetratricopeptide repeat protein [Cyclobacteriaceae bacterium]